jgi:spore coat protein U-like protein
MFKKIAIASAAYALLSAWHGAMAGNTTPAPINVSATVSTNCLVTTPAADQTGLTYDPVSANAATDNNFTASVVFKCTKNSTGVTVGIDAGLHFSGGTRRLSDGSGAPGPFFLNYDLYQPAAVGSGAACAYTTAYDNSTNAFGVGSTNFTTAATLVTVKVCGKIPQAQDVGPGTYTDTVNLQVNF